MLHTLRMKLIKTQIYPRLIFQNLKHPSSINIDWEADKYEFKHHYLGNKKKYLFFLNSFINKLIEIFKISS